MSESIADTKKTGHEPWCHCQECYEEVVHTGTLYRDLWLAAKEVIGGDPIQVFLRMKAERDEARRLFEDKTRQIGK